MPIFDLECSQCGVVTETLVRAGEKPQCEHCGGVTVKIWASRGPTMIRDSIRGGIVLENLTPQPKRFYSRTEIKDEMRARGVVEMVRHVSVPGSDKSPHTTRHI